ncbi:hypothetical protein BDZ45DRAFT_735777 [Acephala macrosclerotiorum]|nr:hypothetical protein BDZ45DRAFT_735777 [Acephala macrosclerotiorum]
MLFIAKILSSDLSTTVLCYHSFILSAQAHPRELLTAWHLKIAFEVRGSPKIEDVMLEKFFFLCLFIRASLNPSKTQNLLSVRVFHLLGMPFSDYPQAIRDGGLVAVLQNPAHPLISPRNLIWLII